MNKTKATLFCACALLAAKVALAGTTGNIRGVVSDAETKEPIAGVTVVATSPGLQGEEVTLTDEKGRYLLTQLPPGVYTVRFTFAGASAERNEIRVSLDTTLTVNAQMSTAAATAEVYTIEDQVPTVDVASTTMGVNITKEFINNVPLGRSRDFQTAIDVLPSAVGDLYGVSVAGATSPENQYVIDGLNTTDPEYGLAGGRLVLDFIEEFDIKEGGYAAEFGRATGAFVNAVTKSGGNEFHGSVFAYYRPGFLQADAKKVQRRGESISLQEMINYYLNVGFEVGGPIIEDTLWFHAGYAPEIRSDIQRRKFHARQEDPANPGTYLEDEFGIPDTKEIATDDHKSLTIVHQFSAKLTHLIDEDQRHSVTVNGAPGVFRGAYTNYLDPNSPVLSSNGDPETFKMYEKWGNIDAIYKYGGKFLEDKVEVNAWLGIHHQTQYYRSLNKGLADKMLLGYEVPYDLRDVSTTGPIPDECKEENDIAAGSLCVTEGYSRGGFGQGLLSNVTFDRYVERLDTSYLFDFAGLHQVKAGLDFEQNLASTRRKYSGRGFASYYGEEYVTQSFALPEEDEFTPAKSMPAKAGSYNWGVFLQDTWNPMPSFTLNYGLRWEGQEFLGTKIEGEGLSRTLQRDKREKKELKILDNWAPRIGATWDFLSGVLGEGRSKLFAHYGRYYESMPLDIVNRAFAGETMLIQVLGAGPGNCGALEVLDTDDPLTQCADANWWAGAYGGEDAWVVPGLKGQYSDEVVAGFSVEVLPSWVLGFTGVYRDLGRVIEDISTDGGHSYIVANPGEFDDKYIADLDRAIATATSQDEISRMRYLREQWIYINDFPRPRREFIGLEFTLDKKLAENFLIRGSYLLSWVRGNFPGLFSDNQGQLDPNLTSTYDLPTLMLNRDGYMPQDRRHRIKIDGFYQIALEDFGIDVPLTVTPGGSLRVSSGRPVEALGRDPLYGRMEIYVIERGGAGRTPWNYSVDLHLGLRYSIDADMGVEFTVDLFNVTNSQEAVRYAQEYTVDEVRPIIRGGEEDLKHLRTTAGTPPRLNWSYKNETQYQVPFGATLGLRFFF